MKTNIKVLFAAALAALTVGCTDLDVPVESQYTSYPTNEAEVTGMTTVHTLTPACTTLLTRMRLSTG